MQSVLQSRRSCHFTSCDANCMVVNPRKKLIGNLVRHTLVPTTRGHTRKKLRTVILKVCVFRFLIGSELLESFVAHHKTKMNHCLDDGMKLESVENDFR